MAPVWPQGTRDLLEIRFGMGASLVGMAKNAPERTFIGIGCTFSGCGACLGTAGRRASPTCASSADAVEVLEHMIPNGSLSLPAALLPGPWRRSRHHKRRIVQPAFARISARSLPSVASSTLATDWENYAEHMLEVMSAAEGVRERLRHRQLGCPVPTGALTKFEQRGRRLGHGVWI